MGSPGKISLALAAAGLLAAVPGVAPAQNISIDGRFSQAKTLNAVGGNYPITPDLGKQVGGNLFMPNTMTPLLAHLSAGRACSAS